MWLLVLRNQTSRLVVNFNGDLPSQSAKELGIPVYQPASIRGQDAEELIASLSPDLIISAAYGKILPKNILNIPNKGCLNVHGSLLPKYRGAAPVQWAIYNGDDKTGVTLMHMDDGIDTGDIISVAETPITLDMNAAILMDELSTLGTELLIKTLPGYLSGKIIATPQEHSEATYAPMITKEQGRIDWSRSAMEIHNQIRAFSIWPAAYTTYKGRTLKIHCSYVESDQSKILCDYRDTLQIQSPEPSFVRIKMYLQWLADRFVPICIHRSLAGECFLKSARIIIPYRKYLVKNNGN